jgi:hypothetical protein
VGVVFSGVRPCCALLADALSKDARGLGIAKVAWAKQLAHDNALPVAGLECLRRDIGDIACRHHRDGKVWCDRVCIDSLVLDKPERVVEVLEEGYRTKKEHVCAHEPFEALFLCVQARYYTCPFAQIGTKAAQRGDVVDAALADGFHDGLALSILLGAVVGRASIGRKQCVNCVRTAKGLCQEGGVGRFAAEYFGSSAREFRELAPRSAQCPDLLAGFEQCFSDLFSGVSGGSHDGDHIILLVLVFTNMACMTVQHYIETVD